MSSVKELKIDTNVILKLNLGEKGGIRRIRLSKIWSDNGGGGFVDYEKLKKFILELDSTSTGSSSNKKEVVMTYKDEDDDIITISTNEELSDAFLQFVDKVPPILRASATTTTTTTTSSSSGTDKRNNDHPPPQVVKLVDAIHEAVSNALDTAWPPRRNSKTPSSNNTTTTTTTTHEQADTMAKRVVSNLKPENLTTTHPCTTKHSNHNTDKSGEKKEEEESIKSKSKSKEESPSSEEEVDWSKFDKSFIHGRHTCDGCLITPIVGIRYHAKNICDYDLCQKCIAKSSNQKVNFQPAQLERDVPFQARWWRRQQRLELQQKQRLSFLATQQKNQPHNDEEEDIKEAIRLSLLSSTNQHDNNKQDTFQKELQAVAASLKPADDTSIATKDPPSFKNEKTEEALDTHQTATATTNDTDKTHKKEEEQMVETTILLMEQPTTPFKQTNEDKATKEVQTCTKSCDETNYSDSSFATDAEGNGDVAVAIGQTLDKCAEEINAIVSEIGKSSSSSDVMASSLTSFDSALQNHNDDTLKNEKINADDNHSTAGETILESVQDNDTKTKEEVDDDSWQVLENSQTIQDEMVARAASLLGSILFTSEISQDSSNDSKNQDHPQHPLPFESFCSTESSVPPSVPSEAKNEDHPQHPLPFEESFCLTESSVPSSVPSVVPSVESEIPVTVLSRWDVELKQLHEFGFLDDLKNVQVLEKLEAANIGSDCPEHVTVSQAIGELLEPTNQEK